jgi:uncharacterized membrane protein YuzA (DUF378 family)
MRNPYDTIGRVGLLLAVVGAVNWLLVGLFEWNLVKWIFTPSGTQTVDNLGERVVYVVVGVGGVLAIPMLAATLSRARGRDVRSGEGYETGRSRDAVDENDTEFYLGAPKEAHAEGRSDIAAASAEGRAAEQSGPVRRTEHVIIRTEEPMIGSVETSSSGRSAETSSSGRSAETGTSGSDAVSGSVSDEHGATRARDLRYGTVEEADDDVSEERRAA